MFETIIVYLMNTFSITKIKLFLSFIFSCFCITIGGYSQIVEAMYILLVLDFILGFIFAWKNNNISKKKMQLGAIKMFSYSVTLIVLNYADISTMGANIYGMGIKEFGISYLAINEALSCLKHLGNLGVPIPVGLINKLENYKDNLTIKDFTDKK